MTLVVSGEGSNDVGKAQGRLCPLIDRYAQDRSGSFGGVCRRSHVPASCVVSVLSHVHPLRPVLHIHYAMQERSISPKGVDKRVQRTSVAGLGPCAYDVCMLTTHQRSQDHQTSSELHVNSYLRLRTN